MRFNPAPGWPPPPSGWLPPPGWQPDPSWPQPPADWKLWIYDDDDPETPGEFLRPGQKRGASKNRRVGMGLSTGRIALIVSAGLMAVGIFELFFNKRDANLVANLFTVTGVAIALLQVFVRFPVIPIGADPPQGTHSGPTSAETRDEGSVSARLAFSGAAPRIPMIYGVAFWLSAILLTVAVIWLLEGGNYESTETSNNYVIAAVAASFLYVIGLPGFHALQAAKAGHYSLIGCVLSGTATVVSILQLWVYADAVDQGALVAPPSFHELGVVASWLAIFATCFIAVAVMRAGVYPRWTAWILLAGAILSFVWLAGGDTNSTVVFYRLDSLFTSAATAAFGWYMVRQRLTPSGRSY